MDGTSIKLSDFVESERKRFYDKYNNLFTFSFAQVQRYYEFVNIILGRYKSVSTEFLRMHEAFNATILNGTHQLTAEQLLLFEEKNKISITLHLEIESFYLFAKILLQVIPKLVDK